MTSEECRKIVDWLKLVHGMSYGEIARRIGCTSAAVGRWMRGAPVGRVLGERLDALYTRLEGQVADKSRLPRVADG